MIAGSTPKIPKLRVHKASGQAYIFTNGKRIYFGPHGLPTTIQKYHRLAAEMAATGGLLPPPPTELLTIKELMARFWTWAETYYVNPDGSRSPELEKFRYTFRPLKELYGDLPAVSFGPRALQAVRQKMIEMGWCRVHINKHVQLVKTVFRWGTEQELIPGTVYHALQAVTGLRHGRSTARESEPVRPVAVEHINAIQPFVSRQVWALVQLQLLTGARPGELLKLRKGDIDQSASVWSYMPPSHKTAYRGHARIIYFGPKAQEVLTPFLLRPDDAPLFSPAEAGQERLRQRCEKRRTPLSCGNRPGTNRVEIPQRKAGDTYDVAAYRRAITYGCDRAFPLPETLKRTRVPLGDQSQVTRRETVTEWKKRLGTKAWAELKRWQSDHRWHPHQLRHTAATLLRKEMGLEAARVVLGHRSACVTELYAEMDRSKAVDAIRKLG